MSCTIVLQAAFFGRHLFADHHRLAEQYLGRLDNLWRELTSKLRARKLNCIRCEHSEQGLAGQILHFEPMYYHADWTGGSTSC